MKKVFTIALAVLLVSASAALACHGPRCFTVDTSRNIGPINQEAYIDATVQGQKFDDTSDGVLAVGGSYGPTGRLTADHQLVYEDGKWEVDPLKDGPAVNSRAYSIGSDYASAGRLCDPLVVGKMDYGSFYVEGNAFGGYGALAGSGGWTALKAEAMGEAGQAGKVNLAVDGRITQFSGNVVQLGEDSPNYAFGGQVGNADFTAYDNDKSGALVCEIRHYGHSHETVVSSWNAEDYVEGKAFGMGGTLVGSWTDGNNAKSFGITGGFSAAKINDAPRYAGQVNVDGTGGIETQANVLRTNSAGTIYAGANAHGAAGYSYEGSGSRFVMGGGVAMNYTSASIDSYGNNGIISQAGGKSFAAAGTTGQGGQPD